jgi:hypothetical protein
MITTEPTYPIADKLKESELSPGERSRLAQDGERWQRMSAGAHLDDWLDFAPSLINLRHLAMKLNHMNRPQGRGYNETFGRLVDRHFHGMDKTSISAVLWLYEESERMEALREIREAMTPGERSQLNSPIAARTRVKAALKHRNGGADERRTNPNDRIAELERENSCAPGEDRAGGWIAIRYEARHRQRHRAPNDRARWGIQVQDHMRRRQGVPKGESEAGASRLTPHQFLV